MQRFSDVGYGQSIDNSQHRESNYIVMMNIARLAFPIMANQIAGTLNNFGSSLLLSNFAPKEDSSAASAIIFPMQVLYVVVFSAFLFPISFMLQRHAELKDTRKMVSAGILAAFLASLIPTVLAPFTGMLYSSTAPNSITEIVDDYYSVFWCSLPFMLIAVAMEQVAMALHKQKLLYVGSALNLICTLGFSALFTQIYSLEHLDLSDTQTIALGYLVGSVARILLYTADFIRNDFFELPSPAAFTENKHLLTDILKNGLPISIQLFSELAAVSVLSYLTVWLLDNKTENLTILNVMNNYNLFSVILPIALGMAAGIVIGNLREEQKYHDIQRYGNIILAMSTAYNLLWLIAGLAAPETLASLFMDTSDITNNGISGDLRGMFGIIFTGLLFNSYRDVISGELRGLNIYKPPTSASIVALWVIAFVAEYILAKPADLGIAGLLTGYYIGTFSGAMYLLATWLENSQPEQAKLLTDDENAKKQVDRYTYVPGCNMYNPPRERSDSAEPLLPPQTNHNNTEEDSHISSSFLENKP